MSEGIQLKSWEEFEGRVTSLVAKGTRATELVFRGQNNSESKLKTTLERYSNEEERSFLSYYHIVSRAQPQIETFTGKSWKLPEHETFCDKVKDYDSSFPSFMQNLWTLDGYAYLIYLRQHGFPSPLLDWSLSKYIAAYFAFRSPQEPKSGFVSIYAYCECVGAGKVSSSNRPRICLFGPYINSHPRHFLQQSRYTICTEFKGNEWILVPHDRVLSLSSKEQDVVWKFDLPWSERTKVLQLFDSYTLNAYSLFGSEESLMETMAFREFNT